MRNISQYKFIGEIHPMEYVPRSRAKYSIGRASGSMTIIFDGSKLEISFLGESDSFENVFTETKEFVQGFLSLQAVKTGLSLNIVFTEWLEIPLALSESEKISHPVRGHIYNIDPEFIPIPHDIFAFTLADGLRWVQTMDINPFLRRAVIDFNYALQQPLNDVPIYLYRSVESIQAFFGGEAALINTLKVEKQVKKIKRLANGAQDGFHARHAAKTEMIREITKDDVVEIATCAKEIIEKFQMVAWIERERDGNSLVSSATISSTPTPRQP